jgi:hypothetical protein
MLPFTRFLITIVMAVGLGLAATSEARADAVVFSNFGPGTTFNTSTAWNVSGTNIFSGRVVAQSFTPSDNFTFSSAQLAMGIVGGPNILQVVLMTSSGGFPGAIVETITLTDAVAPIGTGGIVLANSALQPLLSAGTQYWIVAFAPEDDTFMGWNLSLNDFSAPVLLNGSHSLTGPWEFSAPRGAFQVNGTPVPEPATMLLLGASLTVIALRKCKRKSGNCR